MLKVIIDDIFAMSGGRVFQQTVGILMGTNCASLADYMGAGIGYIITDPLEDRL
jgi:hypothetical protein